MTIFVYVDKDGIPCVDVDAVLVHYLPEVERCIRECGLKPKCDTCYSDPKKAEAWKMFIRDLKLGDFEDRTIAGVVE